MHVAKDVLTDQNRIDPDKIDLMGRLGRAYYVRCSGPAIHTIVQNYKPATLGFDQLPEHIKNSPVLTGNDLGKLAGQVELPSAEEMDEAGVLPGVKEALEDPNATIKTHYLAKSYLDQEEIRKGFSILLLSNTP
jgi:hypothetical protein